MVSTVNIITGLTEVLHFIPCGHMFASLKYIAQTSRYHCSSICLYYDFILEIHVAIDYDFWVFEFENLPYALVIYCHFASLRFFVYSEWLCFLSKPLLISFWLLYFLILSHLLPNWTGLGLNCRFSYSCLDEYFPSMFFACKNILLLVFNSLIINWIPGFLFLVLHS